MRDNCASFSVWLITAAWSAGLMNYTWFPALFQPYLLQQFAMGKIITKKAYLFVLSIKKHVRNYQACISQGGAMFNKWEFTFAVALWQAKQCVTEPKIRCTSWWRHSFSFLSVFHLDYEKAVYLCTQTWWNDTDQRYGLQKIENYQPEGILSQGHSPKRQTQMKTNTNTVKGLFVRAAVPKSFPL